LSRRDDKDFKRRHGREPIGQRAILDADDGPRPSLLWLLGDNRISGNLGLTRGKPDRRK
jgi:hypothetical protein